MSSILAIAILTVRSAIRSKLVLFLLLLLLLVLVGVPLTIHGDGTLDGRVRIMLSYSLGLASAILGLFTLWTSCVAIAQEIKDRQIHQIVTKPVHAVQVWVGKWLGLLALNAVFLAVTGAATWAFATSAARDPGVPPADRERVNRQILVGRRLISPRPEAPDLETRARIDSLTRTGRLADEIGRLTLEGKVPPKPSNEEVFLALKKEMLGSRSAVPVGGSRQWTFDLPRHRSGRGADQDPGALSIRFHLSPMFHERLPVRGIWTVGTPSAPGLFRYEPSRDMLGSNTFSVDVPLREFGSGPLVLNFANGGRDISNVAVFDISRNVELLVAESPFAANLFRSLLVIFCLLALLAAVGLCASTLLSFPVAVFSATALIAVVLLVHYFTYTLRPEVAAMAHSHDSEGPGLLERGGGRLAGFLAIVTEPVMRYPTLDLLADGIQVSNGLLARAALFLVMVYSGFFALAGSLALRHRELALPD